MCVVFGWNCEALNKFFEYHFLDFFDLGSKNGMDMNGNVFISGFLNFVNEGLSL